MKQREDIETILQNEPLIHASASLDGLFFPWDESRGGSIYYGTGLTTPKAPSIGLPFDVLILVLVAERMRTLLGLTEIHHHIADTHALTNSFCTKEQVDAMAQE